MNALFKPMIILQNGFDLMIPHSTVSIDVPQSMQHWDHGATTCSSVRATLESWSLYLFDTMSALKVSNGIYALRSLFFYASVLMMILLSMI